MKLFVFYIAALSLCAYLDKPFAAIAVIAIAAFSVWYYRRRW